MSAPAYLIEAGIYLTSAVIAVPLFKRLGLGSVLGYLLAGIIIGPQALKLIADPERVLHFAEFGVVMLLFLVGLELEPHQAWKLRKALLGLGGLQVATTIVIATGLSMALAWPIPLVAAIGIAMSSTAIGLASLEERQLLHTPGGQASFAVLLFQDLSVIPLLMILGSLAPGAHDGNRLLATGKAILVIGGIFLASRTVIRPLMRVVAKTGMREVFLSFSLLLVIGVSLAVQWAGLSMALGTFLAGILLADSEYRYELQQDIEPVKGLLLGLFFIAVGMAMDLGLIAHHPFLIFGLAIAILAIKAGLLYALGRVFKLDGGGARLFAVGLSQVGEFAFVIYNLGFTQGTLNRPIYDTLNAVAAVTMLMTPILFVLHDRFSRGQKETRPDEIITEENPVIVAGFGRFGQTIVRVLSARGFRTTLIDRDPSQVELVRSFGWKCYYGDASRLDLLRQAGILRAKLLVIAIDNPELAVKMARLVQERWPNVQIVARARSRLEAFEFMDMGLTPIRETFHSSLEAAAASLRALGIPPLAAERVIRRFEQHDKDMLVRSQQVRHDQKAFISTEEEGRRSLEALLAADQAEAMATEKSE